MHFLQCRFDIVIYNPIEVIMYNIIYLGVFRFTDMEIAKIFITYRGY